MQQILERIAVENGKNVQSLYVLCFPRQPQPHRPLSATEIHQICAKSAQFRKGIVAIISANIAANNEANAAFCNTTNCETTPVAEVANLCGTETANCQTWANDTGEPVHDWRYYFDMALKAVNGVNTAVVNPPPPPPPEVTWLGVSPFVWLGGGLVLVLGLFLVFKPSK